MEAPGHGKVRLVGHSGGNPHIMANNYHDVESVQRQRTDYGHTVNETDPCKAASLVSTGQSNKTGKAAGRQKSCRRVLWSCSPEKDD